MPHKLSVKDLPLNGKKVLMRVDFNVPLDEKQQITDDTRIRAALPTIQYILDNGGALLLMSHLGRPKEGPDPRFSLAPCAKRLSELLKMPVPLAPDCIGESVQKMLPEPGQVLLLENLRFHKGEKHPEEDRDFVNALVKLGDCYVNDAFGTAHRKHASTYQVPLAFQTAAAAGLLMEKEIAFLGDALKEPKRPFYALIGGAKISTKLGVLRALLHKVDALLIGGGMAYTFFKAQGIAIGNSICEESLLQEAKEIQEAYRKAGVKLFLPDDLLIADSLSSAAKTEVIEVQNGIPEGFEGVDIGPKTTELYSEEVKNAGLIIWNGPMGVFELSPFAKGTYAMAKALAASSATTIVGGGDSVAAERASGVAHFISHISTGGGAALEYIEKGQLPGIEVLTSV